MKNVSVKLIFWSQATDAPRRPFFPISPFFLVGKKGTECEQSQICWLLGIRFFVLWLLQFICLINFVNISTEGVAAQPQRQTFNYFISQELPCPQPRTVLANSLCTSPKINGRRPVGQRKSLTNFLGRLFGYWLLLNLYVWPYICMSSLGQQNHWNSAAEASG